MRAWKQLVALVIATGIIAGVTSRASADIIYSTTFSTSAFLSCGPPRQFPVHYQSGTCTSNGNSHIDHVRWWANAHANVHRCD